MKNEPRAHTLDLEVRRGDGRFRGACACGWTTAWLGAAGMVHGSHAEHLDAVELDWSVADRRER